MAELPPDLFHLLAAELADRADFGTLYNCVASSKYLANAGSVSALYRISLSDKSPLKGGGGDSLSFVESDLAVMRWSILWRTLTLSALGKTLHPYCRHLRELDLRDLSALLDRLDESNFRNKMLKQFFAGDLSGFHHVQQTNGKYRATRLDARKILLDIGDLITQKAPMLEGIAEPSNSDVLSSALPSWVPRLSHLHELELWDAKALADETLRNLLHAHCSKLHQLRMHHSFGTEPDHYLADFISGMPRDVLTSFYNMSMCSIGPETCLAFTNHGNSLTTLKLGLDEDGMLALGFLHGCKRVQTLQITALRPSVDLKATQNDVYLEITEWLKQCEDLTDVTLQGLVSAPDLLLPVLLNQNVRLTTLRVSATEGSSYQVKDHRDFHKALSTQSDLRILSLYADPDPMTRDDVEVLLDTLCRLKNLRELGLYRISDYFTNEHIKLLAQQLLNLHTLYVGGYGITDIVWYDLGGLKHLKNLTFAGLTAFTTDGILTFIDQMEDGNMGLALSIELANPDSMIPEEGQEVLRDALASKVNGRFEYQPLRDPNVPEFDGSDSD